MWETRLDKVFVETCAIAPIMPKAKSYYGSHTLHRCHLKISAMLILHYQNIAKDVQIANFSLFAFVIFA